jgi:glycosyltransferase involved in cell wall biosynthesis
MTRSTKEGTSLSKRRNVLQVSKFYYPDVGGVERVVQQLAEGMSGKHNVRVLAATPKGRGERDSVNGVPIVRASSFGTPLSMPAAPTFPIHLTRMQRGADIVHYHLPNPLSVASYFFSPTTEAKTVVTYHSDIVRQATALKAYRPILHRFLNQVDRIIVTSPNLLDSSEHLSPHREKCRVVPLSIDLDEYERPQGTPPELPVSSDRPTILFVGRLIYYKGIEYLVDAMSDVDATLLIAGDGELREQLQTRAKSRGVADKVHFLGYVPNEHLHHCYEAADLFVLPSVEPSEAFGIVQLEAMAYETPIVNTDLRTGVPWVSRDSVTGRTVPPRNAQALARAINDLISDDDLRNTYGEKARKRVENEFSEATMLSRTNKVYREVLSE